MRRVGHYTSVLLRLLIIFVLRLRSVCLNHLAHTFLVSFASHPSVLVCQSCDHLRLLHKKVLPVSSLCKQAQEPKLLLQQRYLDMDRRDHHCSILDQQLYVEPVKVLAVFLCTQQLQKSEH